MGTVKKQELVHLHALLARVADYCQEEGLSLDLSAYHKQDTHPMAISHSKGDHEAAVEALAAGIVSAIEGEEDDREEHVTAGVE